MGHGGGGAEPGPSPTHYVHAGDHSKWLAAEQMDRTKLRALTASAKRGWQLRYPALSYCSCGPFFELPAAFIAVNEWRMLVLIGIRAP